MGPRKLSPEQASYAEKAIEAMVSQLGVDEGDLTVCQVEYGRDGTISHNGYSPRSASFVVAYVGSMEALDLENDPESVTPTTVMVGADEEKGVEGWATPVVMDRLDHDLEPVPMLKIPASL